MKPLRLVHRGTVAASALLFDAALLGESEARARVLAHWHSGASLERIGALLLLRFAKPRWLACEAAPGEPLIEIDGALSAVPLEREERRALAPLAGQVLRARGGALAALRGGAREDPAAWLEAASAAVLELAPLGAVPEIPPLALVAQVIERGNFAVPPADPGAAAFLAGREDATRARAGGPHPALLAALRSAARAMSWVSSWVARTLLPFSPAAAGPSPSRGAARVAPARLPRPPGFFEKLSARLDRLLAQMAVLTRLSKLLSARQAAYLRKLLEALDENDVEASLRAAIPLGVAGGEFSGPALGLPAQRQDLSISLRQTSGLGSAIGLGGDLYNELKARYRRLFERLDRQGQIDQAAFVLAELLREDSEAVQYLEKHERLVLAAQLAEARALPAGRVVRQWILAGDPARAVDLARLRGAFAEAVALLEKEHHQHARAARLLWADAAAAGGDFATAIDAIAPLPEGRALAAKWLGQLFQQGGAVSARWLAKQLCADPELLPGLPERARLLLEDRAPETADERVAFALGLAAAKTAPELAKPLAREAARAVLRDKTRETAVPAAQFDRLLQLSGDKALRADLPAALREILAPLRPFAIEAADGGTLQLTDVALATRGRILVALGEAGARLCAPDGRELFHFAAPAHQLVMSDLGDRALALAPRGPATLVTQLDLSAGRAREWGTLPITQHTDGYDGALWFVAMGSALVCLDATADSPRPLWRAETGPVLAISRASGPALRGVYIVCADRAGSLFRCCYSLPGCVLRERVEISGVAVLLRGSLCLDEQGTVGLIEQRKGAGPGLVFTTLKHNRRAGRDAALVCDEKDPFAEPLPSSPDTLPRQRSLSIRAGRLAAARAVEDGMSLRLLQPDTAAIELAFRGSGALAHRWQRAGARELLLLCDDRGRVVAVDPQRNQRVVDLRL